MLDGDSSASVHSSEHRGSLLKEVDIKRKGSDYVLTAVVEGTGTRYQDAIFLYDVAVYNSRSISCL